MYYCIPIWNSHTICEKCSGIADFKGDHQFRSPQLKMHTTFIPNRDLIFWHSHFFKQYYPYLELLKKMHQNWVQICLLYNLSCGFWDSTNMHILQICPVVFETTCASYINTVYCFYGNIVVTMKSIRSVWNPIGIIQLISIWPFLGTRYMINKWTRTWDIQWSIQEIVLKKLKCTCAVATLWNKQIRISHFWMTH